jgi:capsular polysaccharide biosynthesis protein
MSAILPAEEERPIKPVITYISRQGRSRSLQDVEHTRLVGSLEALAARKGYTLEIPSMENLTKEEQFSLAGRTTVLLGVHGSE